MRLLKLAIVLLGAVGGCSDVTPTAFDIRPGMMQTPQWCETHPIECGVEPSDPFPRAAGYFIGWDYTFANCMRGANGPGGDLDQDMLADRCESLIAAFFAPLLIYGSSESSMGRETYWAAKPTELGVEIFYALGYYRDEGSYSTLCLFGIATDACAGHWGDSEHVVVSVRYEGETNHWVLSYVFYSQHGTSHQYQPNYLEFPERRDLTHPAVHVSLGKHANYRNDHTCDEGGTLGTDVCQGDRSERVYVSALRNLGSSSHQLKNCVLSEENIGYRESGRVECFWTAEEFTGWTGVRNPGDPVNGYKHALLSLGF